MRNDLWLRQPTERCSINYDSVVGRDVLLAYNAAAPSIQDQSARIATPYGVAIDMTRDDVLYPSDARIQNSDIVTVQALVWTAADAAGMVRIAGTCSSLTTSNRRGWEFGFDGGTFVEGQLQIFDGIGDRVQLGAGQTVFSGTDAVGKLVFLTVEISRTSTTNFRNWVTINGRTGYSGVYTHANLYSNNTSLDNQIKLGGKAEGDPAPIAGYKILQVLMRPRAITEGERIAWERDPWQAFAPKRKPTFIGPRVTSTTKKWGGKASSSIVRTTQPTFPVEINWDNEITKGLVFCPVPTGSTFFDVVTKAFPISQVGTSRAAIVTRNGGTSRVESARAVELDVGCKFTWATEPCRGQSMQSQGTMLALMSKVGTTNGIAPIFGNTEYVTDGHGWFLSMDDNSYTPYVGGPPMKGNALGVGANYPNLSYTLSDNSDPSDQLHFFGFATEDAGANVDWFYRGRVYSQAGTDTTTGVITNRRATVGGTAYGASTADVPFRLVLAMMWERKLTAAEYKSLYDNPWQIFKPDVRHAWTLHELAQQYPTLSLPQLINLLQTQATPRVTITVP